MGGGSSTKGGMAMHKIPLPPNSLQEGRTAKGTQKETLGNSSWRVSWLFGKLSALPGPAWNWRQHLLPNSHIPWTVTVLPQTALLEDPRSSQKSLSGMRAPGHGWGFTPCQGSNERWWLKQLSSQVPYIRFHLPPLTRCLTIQGGTEEVKQNTWHSARLHPNHRTQEHAMEGFSVLFWDRCRDWMMLDAQVFF